MLHIGTKYHSAVAMLNEKHRRALERVQEDYATELMEISLQCETEMDQCLRTFKGEALEPSTRGNGGVKPQAPVQDSISAHVHTGPVIKVNTTETTAPRPTYVPQPKGEVEEPPTCVSGRVKPQAAVPVSEVVTTETSLTPLPYPPHSRRAKPEAPVPWDDLPVMEPIRPPQPKRAVDMLSSKDEDPDFFPRVVTSPR